ncbi:MAG TPA: copper resistance protein CopC, partial [Actinotalea sp.]|nr:copper resistance protein CopC [Actinotalea sp.]
VLVTGPGGAVAVGEPVVQGTTVTAPLPSDLASGDYTIAWRVVSADGHPIQGTIPFTVALPVAETTPASTSPPPTTPTADPSPLATATAPTTPTTPDGSRGPLVAGAVAVALALATAAVVVLERRPGRTRPPAGDSR